MKNYTLCIFSFLISGLFHVAAESDRDAKLQELKTLQSAMNQAQQAQNLDEANKIAQQIHHVIAEFNDMKKRDDSNESAPAPTNPVAAAATQSLPQEPAKPAPVAKRSDTYEDEILRLADRRDTEIAQALAPIERRFDLGSQQLLRKTMQSGNLEAANELKVMLENPQKTAVQHDQTANLPQEKEMVRLMEQREKEISQASAPIQKRFELGTQQILRKALQTGDLETANKLKETIEKVAVASGKFNSGSQGSMVLVEENGQLAAFEIGKYEVTWGEWKKVRDWAVKNGYDLENSGSAKIGEGASNNHPVTSISWYDAVKWCNAKSEMNRLEPVYEAKGSVFKTGEYGRKGSHKFVTQKNGANGYRLPISAEWEWAARGGKKSQGLTYAGSNDINSVAWFNGNSKSIQPVGQKNPNELELYDMSGNVYEFCFDQVYNGDRVRRGGSFGWDQNECAVSSWKSEWPDARYFGLGFRLARNSN
jgi:formylglycine-generating enzyme required for sulfatase activity